MNDFQNNELSIENKITNALFYFLNNKKYGEIYIKDICEKANINRSIFYKYYHNINDLFIKTEQKLDNELIEMLNKNLGLDDITQAFKFIYKHKSFYEAFYLINFDSYHEIGLNFHSQNKLNYSSIPYEKIFFIGGFKTLAKQWVLFGCKETPEEMAKIIYKNHNI